MPRDNSESELAPSAGRHRTNPRLACEPCRNRKVKCTGERPACARCVRTRKECEYIGNASQWGNHLQTIEDRLRAVEDMARGPEPREVHDSERSRQHLYQPTEASRSISPSVHMPTPDGRESESHSPPHARSSASASRPFTTQPIPMTALSSIRTSLPSNAQILNTFSTGQDLVSMLQRPSTTTSNITTTVVVDRSILPSQTLINALIDYFSYHHNAAYPIFHMPTLRAQVQAVCFGTEPSEAIDVCSVFHVLAVASASLKPSSPMYRQLKPFAASFWEAAQAHLDAALAQPSLSRLQILLIHLQYLMFNPGGMSVWDLSGMAVRSAIDLGLHCEPPHTSGRPARGPLELDMRRRLFWTAYSTDRMLCLLLGRPTAIPDAWINVGLPLTCDDECITPDAILSGHDSPLKATVLHHIRVRLIQSEIHDRLYTPRNACPDREWFDSITKRLQDWIDTWPATTGFISRAWLEINVSLTRVQLHRPTPANPTPGRDDLEKAFKAAGELMRGYREWQRAGQVNSLWLASYQLFIAGLTYLNSLWQAHRSGWTIVASLVDALLHVQMCSNTMEAIAAVTPETKDLRDAFETVSEQIIRQLASREQWTNTNASASASLMNAGSGSQAQQASSDLPSTVNGITIDSIFSDSAAGAMPEMFDDANLFNDFFLQPMSGLSSSDWTRSIDSVVELLQTNDAPPCS